jgi:hypothetical protein
MAVRIDEMSTTIDAVDGDALLTPRTLERIVRAVLVALDNRQEQRDTLDTDRTLRSVVEQQRGGRA